MPLTIYIVKKSKPSSLIGSYPALVSEFSWTLALCTPGILVRRPKTIYEGFPLNPPHWDDSVISLPCPSVGVCVCDNSKHALLEVVETSGQRAYRIVWWFFCFVFNYFFGVFKKIMVPPKKIKLSPSNKKFTHLQKKMDLPLSPPKNLDPPPKKKIWPSEIYLYIFFWNLIFFTPLPKKIYFLAN